MCYAEKLLISRRDPAVPLGRLRGQGRVVDYGAQDDPDPSPILVGLEPSVLSLATGSETSLQLVARGAPAEPYRIPLTVSFDPARVAIESIATVEGVVARFQDLEPSPTHPCSSC